MRRSAMASVAVGAVCSGGLVVGQASASLCPDNIVQIALDPAAGDPSVPVSLSDFQQTAAGVTSTYRLGDWTADGPDWATPPVPITTRALSASYVAGSAAAGFYDVGVEDTENKSCTIDPRAATAGGAEGLVVYPDTDVRAREGFSNEINLPLRNGSDQVGARVAVEITPPGPAAAPP